MRRSRSLSRVGVSPGLLRAGEALGRGVEPLLDAVGEIFGDGDGLREFWSFCELRAEVGRGGAIGAGRQPAR